MDTNNIDVMQYWKPGKHHDLTIYEALAAEKVRNKTILLPSMKYTTICVALLCIFLMFTTISGGPIGSIIIFGFYFMIQRYRTKEALQAEQRDEELANQHVWFTIHAYRNEIGDIPTITYSEYKKATREAFAVLDRLERNGEITLEEKLILATPYVNEQKVIDQFKLDDSKGWFEDQPLIIHDSWKTKLTLEELENKDARDRAIQDHIEKMKKIEEERKKEDEKKKRERRLKEFQRELWKQYGKPDRYVNNPYKKPEWSDLD